MPDFSWIGTYSRFRAFRFDKGWPTLELFRGDDTTILFSAQTSGSSTILAESGYLLTTVDLTNARAIFVFADLQGNVLFTKQSNNGAGEIAITDAINGKMTIQIAAADTINLELGVYSVSVAVKDNTTGEVAVVARSTVFLYRSLLEKAPSW